MRRPAPLQAPSGQRRRRQAEDHAQAVHGPRPREEGPPAPPPPPPPGPRDPATPPIRYNINQAFEAGDQLKHRIFGVGIVEELLDPGKMRVYFDGERKVLACAKPGPALERPAPFDE